MDQINSVRRSNRVAALVTNLTDGEQNLYGSDSLPDDSAIRHAVIEGFRRDRSQTIEINHKHYFIQIFSTPLRLMIVGAVHIAQPLIQMSQLCDYKVILIDPRRAFASQERFPNVNCLQQWPDTALRELVPDRRSAVVTLSHDPKIDEPALRVALESEAFYIGALGSRRNHSNRCERLRKAGVTEEDINRIHGPIGLNISAESPAEIAVSIMGEITETLRRRNSL